MKMETLDKLFLEISQFTRAKTRRELDLQAMLDAMPSQCESKEADKERATLRKECSRLREELRKSHDRTADLDIKVMMIKDEQKDLKSELATAETNMGFRGQAMDRLNEELDQSRASVKCHREAYKAISAEVEKTISEKQALEVRITNMGSSDAIDEANRKAAEAEIDRKSRLRKIDDLEDHVHSDNQTLKKYRTEVSEFNRLRNRLIAMREKVEAERDDYKRWFEKATAERDEARVALKEIGVDSVADDTPQDVPVRKLEESECKHVDGWRYDSDKSDFECRACGKIVKSLSTVRRDDEPS